MSRGTRSRPRADRDRALDPGSSKAGEVAQRARALITSRTFIYAILCFGIILRLAQYAFNRSLWFDESLLALNIVNRSAADLLKPLDYNQGAPVGFLLIEKLSVGIFGVSDYSLRLFPLVCGVISLFLFYRVATHFIDPRAVPLALGLFAISDKLIYYSSEVKQYSSDVCVALLLYAAAIHCVQSERLTAPRIALFGAIGGLAIWLSHPAVFILAGVGVSVTWFCLARKDWLRLGRISIACAVWILSFVACYFVSFRTLIQNQALKAYWSGSFIRLPSLTFSYAEWALTTFLGLFLDPAGLFLRGVPAFAFLVGCAAMFYQKREQFFLLILPLPFVLLASGLGLYPFGGRLLLFGVPFLLLFIAEGAAQVMITSSGRANIVGAPLLALLVFPPLMYSSYHLVVPRTFEEIKPVLSYLRQHRQDGDRLYLYYSSWAAFSFYREQYGLENRDMMLGIASRENWNRYREDLDRLRGHSRVWVLFSHVVRDEDRFLLGYLDTIGKRLRSHSDTGAAVYLYDLSTS